MQKLIKHKNKQFLLTIQDLNLDDHIKPVMKKYFEQEESFFNRKQSKTGTSLSLFY